MPQGSARGAYGIIFHGQMHPFVVAVLLRLSRRYPFRDYPKPDPPNCQLREPTDGCRCKRGPVVRSYAFGKAILAKQPLEDLPGFHIESALENRAAEEVPTGIIHDRKRIAPGPVAGLELSLEIRRPKIVRLTSGSKPIRSWCNLSSALPRGHQLLGLEDIVNRCPGGNLPIGMHGPKQIADLFRPPCLVRFPERNDLPPNDKRDPLGTRMGPTALIHKPLKAHLPVSSNPLVPGLSTYSMDFTERREIEYPA